MSGARNWPRVLWSTMRLSVANQFRYPVEWITGTISTLGALLLLVYGTQQAFSHEEATRTGTALLFSFIALAGMQGPVRYLENKSGDLEDVFLTPTPASVLLFCHALSYLMVMFVNISVCYLVLALVFHLPLHGLRDIVSAAPPVFIGTLGFGYLLAGLQLLFKRLGALVSLFSVALLSLAFTPPGWLSHVVWISPYVSGLLALRGGAVAMLGSYLLGGTQLLLGLALFWLAERAMVRLGWSGIR